MTRILLANLASPANPGDQAILQGSLKLLRSFFKDPKITLVTRAISRKSFYEGLGCSTIPSYPNVEPIGTDCLPKKFVNAVSTFYQPGPLWEAVRNSDLIFLAGGAYFYSYRRGFPGLTFLSHLPAVEWARKMKKPVIFLPQSYGPLKSWVSQQLFARAVQRADLVFFRENLSGEWLGKKFPSLGQRFSFMPDLALFLEKEDLLEQVRPNVLKPSRVGVTIRSWQVTPEAEKSYLETLVEALSWLHQTHGLKIRSIVQVQDPKKGEGDEWISHLLEERLIQKLGKESVELSTAHPYFQLKEICSLYRECDFLLATRLHSALLTFLVGRPALVAGYQHKTEGILKALGLEELYLGPLESVGLEGIKKAFENLWQRKEEWIQKIDLALNRARSEIRGVFEKKAGSFFQ